MSSASSYRSIIYLFVFLAPISAFITLQAFPHPVLPPLPKRLAFDKSSWTSALLNPGLLQYQQALANAQLQQASAAFYPTGEPCFTVKQTVLTLLPLLNSDLGFRSWLNHRDHHNGFPCWRSLSSIQYFLFLFLYQPGSVFCMTPANSIGRSLKANFCMILLLNVEYSEVLCVTTEKTTDKTLCDINYL